MLGSNGAGKTTLNRAISGILRARARRDPLRRRDDRRARSRRAIVARGLIQVPEGRRIFPNLSVRGESRSRQLPARPRAPRAEPRARVRDLPASARAPRQRAGTLSGGEQQMLAIGRGLMAEPQLLILDEPSLGLSPLLVEELFALIRRINARRRCRSCWSSRTWCRASKSPTAPTSSPMANSSCPAAPRTSRADPELKRAYLGM